MSSGKSKVVLPDIRRDKVERREETLMSGSTKRRNSCEGEKDDNEFSSGRFVEHVGIFDAHSECGPDELPVHEFEADLTARFAPSIDKPHAQQAVDWISVSTMAEPEKPRQLSVSSSHMPCYHPIDTHFPS